MKLSEEHERLIIALEAASAEHLLQILAGHVSEVWEVQRAESNGCTHASLYKRPNCSGLRVCLAVQNSKHADVDIKELLHTMPQKQKLRCCKALRMRVIARYPLCVNPADWSPRHLNKYVLNITSPANLGQATRALEKLQSSDPSAQQQQTTAAKEDAGIEKEVGWIDTG